MSRPKRKAATNKSYVDDFDYRILQQKSLTSNKHNELKISDKPLKSTVKDKLPSIDPNENGHSTVPMNWQPLPSAIDYFSNKLNLKNAYVTPERSLVRPEHPDLSISKGDFIYMISEPPGEPYYIGKIMGFKRKIKSEKSSNEKQGTPEMDITEQTPASATMFQIQWFYRPRDISKKSPESRLLFASMHTDTCPISSFRGKLTVMHKQDIEDLDEYVKTANNFFFDKLYDRYMMKFYDVISTSYLLKISKNDKSQNFLTALNKRFEYIFIEPQMTKFLINGFQLDSCTCETCGQWCSTQDSVSCADCKQSYHLYCLDPPLMKKPSRGFSWHCEACTKKHIKLYQSKRILMLGHDNKLSNATELTDIELEDEQTSNADSESDTVVKSDVLPRYELMAIEFLKSDKLTLDQRRLAEEWCMRYLGAHSKLEDAVDLDDRSPYPRAATRVGAKHQASHIPECNGHPIVYYDSQTETTSKKLKKQQPVDLGNPLDVPEQYKDILPKKYPEWLQPRPKGYIERGNDSTATLLWKPLDSDVKDNFARLDKYVAQCAPIAETLELSPNSPNFVDAILGFYFKHNGDIASAIDDAVKITRESLKEPILTKEEIKLFEEGVKKYGSELYPVFQHVKTVPCSSIVKFYYLWKKTKNGRLIWGNFEGRLKKKARVDSKDLKQIQYFKEDDESSYDIQLVKDLKFECKHCRTTESIQWFRLTGHEVESEVVTALCFRCAKLWRRYGVVWEDPIEVDKKINKNGKRKIEYELVNDSKAILAEANKLGGFKDRKRPSPSPGFESPSKKKKADPKEAKEAKKPAKKPKAKSNKDEPKIKMEPKEVEIKAEPEPPAPEPTPEPELEPYEVEQIINPFGVPHSQLQLIQNDTSPKLLRLGDFVASHEIPHDTVMKGSRCTICSNEATNVITCGSCQLTVHPQCACIQVPNGVNVDEWLCECCINTLNPIYESTYKCCLCPKEEGYLIPVTETGKWCHITCAMVNAEHIDFRVIQKPKINIKKYVSTISNTKDPKVRSKLIIELIHNSLQVRNVDRLLLMNSHKTCRFCNQSGSLLTCFECNLSAHVSCGNSGFIVQPGDSKIKVEHDVGKLIPSVKCCKPTHEFGTMGKKTPTSREEVPIVQLYLDEAMKSTVARSVGQHIKALNYIKLTKLLTKTQDITEQHHICRDCGTKISPFWRRKEGYEVCQSCFHGTEDEGFKGEEFLHMVNEPINGEQFGIRDYTDRIMHKT